MLVEQYRELACTNNSVAWLTIKTGYAAFKAAQRVVVHSHFVGILTDLVHITCDML
jgi:hypothetical protein